MEKHFHLKKMGYALVAAVMVLFAGSTTAFAAAKVPQPVLNKAQISIEPQGQNANSVTEKLQLSKVNTAKGNQLQFILATFSGETVSNFSMQSDAGPVSFTQNAGDAVTKISTPVPSGASNMNLTLQYTVNSNGNSRIPLVVPNYAPSGIPDAVKLSFIVPSGMHLHSSVPNFAGSDQGTIQDSLVGIPSFASFDYGPNSQFMNFENGVGLLTVLVMLVIIGIWLVGERRTAGGVSNV